MRNRSLSSSLLHTLGTVAMSCAIATLCGCGIQHTATVLPAAGASQTVGGRFMGGELPIIGAAITLYASGVASGTANGAYTGTATVLASTTTDSNGGFSINPASYTCPSNQEVYFVAYGGNPGAGTNNNVLQIAFIGQCGSLNPYTDIDEVTTVASAYAFSGFTTIDTSGTAPVVNVVAPANNASFATSNNVTAGTVTTASGLLHAYKNAMNLASVITGRAYAIAPTNASSIAPDAVVNSIANALQACVNTAGGVANDGSNCGKLFAYTPALDGTLPTNTLQSALNLARHPYISSTNNTNLFNLASPVTVFSPALTAAPRDWTLAIAYPVPPNPVSGVGFPFALALDADDNVYVSSPENDVYIPAASYPLTDNSTSACLFGWNSDGTFRPTITPYTGTPGTPGTQGTGTPGTSTWFCSGAQAATTQNDYVLTQIAPDAVGNIWITNPGQFSAGTPKNYVVQVSNSGSFVAQFAPPTPATLTHGYQPIAVAVDKLNNVWYDQLLSSSSYQTIYALAANTNATGSTGANLNISAVAQLPDFNPAGRTIAFDANQNMIGAAYGGSSGSNGSLLIGDSAFYVPVKNAPTAPSNSANYGVRFSKILGNGGSSGGGVSNGGIFGTAIDSNNNAWFSTISAPNQAGLTNGLWLLREVYNGTPSLLTSVTASTTVTTGVTAPQFMEIDGNFDLWAADSTGIIAYATPSKAVGGGAMMTETGGFSPCIPTGSPASKSCTYPDFNGSTKSVAVDSTGAVWFTTPDTATTNTNANMLFQMIGTGVPTWPLLATGKPGRMPQ